MHERADYEISLLIAGILISPDVKRAQALAEGITMAALMLLSQKTLVLWKKSQQ